MVLKKVKVWLRQRRVWAAIFSAIAAFSISYGYPEIATFCTLLAGSLGLHSYVSPKVE